MVGIFGFGKVVKMVREWIFLEKMNEYYDYIIIDTPPVNLVTDAAALSANVAGVLFVLRYGHTTYEDLNRTVAAFETTGVHILGYTLAEMPSGHGRYYKRKYKKYHNKIICLK